MIKLWPLVTIMISGAFLILIGILFVHGQMNAEMAMAKSMMGALAEHPSQSFQARLPDFEVTTRFPGVELVAIGAMLQIVGYLGGRPWTSSEKI
jgi:hypothetical protein